MNFCFQRTGLLLLLLFISHHSNSQDQKLHKLVFAPQWFPQAQFAGYFVALDKGFYREAGLDVEIIYPSAGVRNTSLLASGKADLISLFLTTGLSARSEKMNIVNIGQLSQHSAILFVTKKSRGIGELSQLNGKKIAIWKIGFDEVPKALIKEKNLSVEWIPVLSTINLFMMDAVDAMTVMSYNEYDQIINSGLDESELNSFPMSGYGFDVPEDGIYCLTTTFEKRKNELTEFMQATLKGWEYAQQNREYAVDVVVERMQSEHIPANRAHQLWMLDKMLEMISPGTKKVKKGCLLETDFQKANDILIQSSNTYVQMSFTDFYKPVLN